MSQRQINIRLNEEELIERFKLQLTGSNKDLLAEAIFGLLEDDWKIERLFKAALGITPRIKFPIGSKVKIPLREISTYSWDKEDMIEQGHIVDDYIEGTIERFTPWKYQFYHIRVGILKNGEPKIIYDTATTDGNGLILAEEWPENKQSQSDELPF